MPNEISLDLWVELVFDQDPKNYNDPDVLFELDSERRLLFLAETFERSRELLARFSDSQIDQALWQSLIGLGSEYAFAIRDESLTWDLRCRAIQSFASLFEQTMAARCTSTLSHFDERPSSPLNSACYMWWDIIPICTSRIMGGDSTLDNEVLAVMARILRIPHVACQESALHGLGHWAFDYPEFVGRTIDAFLKREPNSRPELIRYAEAARTGCIQ